LSSEWFFKFAFGCSPYPDVGIKGAHSDKLFSDWCFSIFLIRTLSFPFLKGCTGRNLKTIGSAEKLPPTHHLYPIQLSCRITVPQSGTPLFFMGFKDRRQNWETAWHARSFKAGRFGFRGITSAFRLHCRGR
jgi:hypothetical protein